MKRIYLVGVVVTERELELSGSLARPTLDMTWADGMIGVIPAFNNKKKAKKYAGKRFKVLEYIVEIKNA